MNSSKFWFNYRQTPNAYIFYDYMKKNGIPEENVNFYYENLNLYREKATIFSN